MSAYLDGPDQLTDAGLHLLVYSHCCSLPGESSAADVHDTSLDRRAMAAKSRILDRWSAMASTIEMTVAIMNITVSKVASPSMNVTAWVSGPRARRMTM